MYDLSLREGDVNRIIEDKPGMVVLEVTLPGEGLQRAISYPALTGSPVVGDRVLLNTTAVDLKLGTGGYHFVCANLTAGGRDTIIDNSAQNTGKNSGDSSGHNPGHIMKMRYTPFQVRTMSVEEETSPYHELFQEYRKLNNYPVVLIPLHSLLAPLVITYRAYYPDKQVVYLMSEGGSLTLDFSNDLRELKKRGYISRTITYGQSYGGDLEAVNIFTALIAAREVARGDLIVIGMGPGIVGTGTRVGFSGAEISLTAHAVRILEGRSILVPRVSFAEKRPRHYGLSHHTTTLLDHLIKDPVDLVLPEEREIRRLVSEAGLAAKHNIFYYLTDKVQEILLNSGFRFSSMGRCFRDDPLFFTTAGLAVYRLQEIFNERRHDKK